MAYPVVKDFSSALLIAASGSVVSCQTPSAAELAEFVAKSKRHIEVTSLRPNHEADKWSLSREHGLREFPFHTDGAHLREPPDLVALHCVNSGNATASTRFLSVDALRLSGAEIFALEHDIYVATGGRGTFLFSILSEGRMRYDPHCMKLMSPGGKSAQIMSLAIGRADLIEHHWKRGETLIWSNSRLLHGRSTVVGFETTNIRTLTRYSIWL